MLIGVVRGSQHQRKEQCVRKCSSEDPLRCQEVERESQRKAECKEQENVRCCTIYPENAEAPHLQKTVISVSHNELLCRKDKRENNAVEGS